MLLLFTLTHLNAQSLELRGTVRDENGEPVVGANVFLVGTYDGASTDADGAFAFTTAEAGAFVLSVSYLGYEEWRTEVELPHGPAAFTVTLHPTSSELDAVVITAGAFEASDGKQSVTLRPLDIVTTAGASGDVVGALQTLPGAQRVGEDGRLFVRGGAAYETRTFIDGLYVARPYTSTTPNVPSRGRFSPLLFKGTTFSTGGYSAEYGQALSSALVLETQDLAPATLTAVSLMSVGGNLSHAQRWENSSVAVSADYTNLAPYMGLVPQNLQWRQAPHTAGGQLLARRRTAAGGQLKLQAQHHRSGMALRTLDPRNLSDSLDVRLINDYSYVGTSYQTTWGDHWQLRTSAAYTTSTDRTETVADLRTRLSALLAKARLSRAVGTDHVLRLGVSHWRETFLDALTFEEIRERKTLREPYTAAFAEADWRVSEKFVARTGVRAEYRRASTEFALSPRLSLAYKTGKKSQFSFATGRFTQRAQEHHLLEYPTLGMEQAWHFITNWQWQKDGRTLRMEAYRKVYDRLVIATEQGLDNGGGGYARGVDLFLRDRTSITNSDFWVAYSYLDTERRYGAFTEQVRPSFAAAHTLNLVYKYWIPRWQSLVGLTGTYATPRDYYHAGTHQGHTTPFRDLSLNWSYLTQIKGYQTVVHAAFSNVLGFENDFGRQFSQQPAADGTYPAVTIRPPAKRFFFVGVFLSIGEDGAGQF